MKHSERILAKQALPELEAQLHAELRAEGIDPANAALVRVTLAASQQHVHAHNNPFHAAPCSQPTRHSRIMRKLSRSYLQSQPWDQ